jgi:glycosyltransferase involved in cell wall biosynthesis
MRWNLSQRGPPPPRRTIPRVRLVGEGLPRDRVDVLPNSVDPRIVAAETVNRRQLMRSVGLAGEATIILMVANLHGVKTDPITAIRAAEAVAERVPNVALVIVGGGEPGSELLDAAPRLRDSSRLVFTGALLDVQPWVAAARMAVIGSVFTP